MLKPGAKLVAIRPMTEAELEREFWDSGRYSTPMALEFEGGIVIFASRDEEGNGPGQLFGYDLTSREQFMLTPRDAEG